MLVVHFLMVIIKSSKGHGALIFWTVPIRSVDWMNWSNVGRMHRIDILPQPGFELTTLDCQSDALTIRLTVPFLVLANTAQNIDMALEVFLLMLFSNAGQEGMPVFNVTFQYCFSSRL